jgi:hypothetical protein
VDPAVPPSGVLAGQPEDQRPEVTPGRRAAGPAADGPGGPAAADDVAVPAHDRVRVTSSRSPWRRALGTTAIRAAIRARSAQLRPGRPGCCRCRTVSWRRRSTISAVFHASLRPDSSSHEAVRVIRRKTSRRHTTGDHHRRAARGATLLVRAVDGILGTHTGWPGSGLANFLSCTVLFRFLTGVGIQVAAWHFPGMLGVPVADTSIRPGSTTLPVLSHRHMWQIWKAATWMRGLPRRWRCWPWLSAGGNLLGRVAYRA